MSLALLRPKRLLSLDISRARNADWTDEEREKLLQEQMHGNLFSEVEERRHVKRLKLQRELPVLKDEIERPYIHDYGIRCIVVAGRAPDSPERRKSLELLRNAMVGVTVLTFDELHARLDEIHAALGPAAAESTAKHGDRRSRRSQAAGCEVQPPRPFLKHCDSWRLTPFK